MIKAILFDLDETLLDRDASILAFLAGQYTRFANALASIPFEHYRDRFQLYDEHGYVAKEIVYGRLVDEFALAFDPSELVKDFYANSWNPCILFPGSIELLQSLRRSGYQLGIITNGSIRTQRPKIEQGGLAQLADMALISEAEGIRKPDAAIFLRATEQLGVEPHECVMVGDNPVADIGGALAVGMKGVWRRGYLPWPADLPVQPHLIVKEVAELLAVDWQQL